MKSRIRKISMIIFAMTLLCNQAFAMDAGVNINSETKVSEEQIIPRVVMDREIDDYSLPLEEVLTEQGTPKEYLDVKMFIGGVEFTGMLKYYETTGNIVQYAHYKGHVFAQS